MALKHGPIRAEDVALLKAGSSVLRQEMGTSGVFAETTGERIRIDGFGGGFCGGPIRTFTYIGELADGWIHAPEGGWSENPAPGMRVTIRCRQDSPVTGISDPFRWVHDGTNPRADIIAFRPSDQPVENSPSPALGGYEPKANEQKDHPTPVVSIPGPAGSDGQAAQVPASTGRPR